MKHSPPMLLAVAATLAALTGCVGHVTELPDAVISSVQPIRYKPVYIVPNCQALGGKTYCQWLEPRGYQQPNPAPAAALPHRVPGIAL